jgi:hypothetical protein
MATVIAMLPQSEAAPVVRPWALPPKLVVSAETRRMLMEIVEEDDEDSVEAPKVLDFAAFRQRKTAR